MTLGDEYGAGFGGLLIFTTIVSLIAVILGVWKIYELVF